MIMLIEMLLLPISLNIEKFVNKDDNVSIYFTYVKRLDTFGFQFCSVLSLENNKKVNFLLDC
jgi:hypothetical protein